MYILDNELALSCITEKPRRGVYNKLLTLTLTLRISSLIASKVVVVEWLLRYALTFG